MNPKAMEPHGIALFDFFNGNISAKFIIYRDDGFTSDLPVIRIKAKEYKAVAGG